MSSSETPLALYCGDFTFQEDSLTKYLICGVCRMVMRNPMRLHRCGHTFCDRCVLSTVCAECLQPFEAKQPDLTAASLVADSMVRCLARDCPFRGTYETYVSTHKNTCKLKHFNGLQGWMEKVKESLDDALGKPKMANIVHCDPIEVEETVRVLPDPSVILEAVTSPNNFSDVQSVVLDSRIPRKIDVDSLYHIHPENEERVAEQMRELKERPGVRRCQYGKECRLLGEGGCPYLHPEKNPRRQYELEKWANIKVVRAPNHPPETELLDEINKRDRQDTQHFLNQYFPVQKIPERKSEPEVQIIPPPHGRGEKGKEKAVIQL